MEKAELIKTLKALVGEKSTDKDALYEFIVDKAWEAVCNYCRIDTVPEGLNYALLSMCVDMCRMENYGEEQAGETTKSVTEGDVSVTFDTASNIADNPMSAFLKDYAYQLNRYRKAGW